MLLWHSNSRILLSVCLILSIALGHISDSSLSIDVVAPWRKIDFIASIIESVSGYDESLYLPTIHLLFQQDDIELDFSSDEDVYKAVINNLGLDASSKDFINFNLVNKVYNPRIVSHYEHYETTLSRLGLNKICSKDSFGDKVETKNGLIPSWVSYNNKVYCSVNDLFALQTDKTTDTISPFDRIIGNNSNAPILILYGDPTADQTREFLRLLIQEADSGKIRFVWRYIPSGSKIHDSLSGYAVDMTLKNSTTKNKLIQNVNLRQEFQSIRESTDLYTIGDKFNDLGLKLVAFLFSGSIKITKYDFLKTIVNDLPKFAPYINNLSDQFNFHRVKSKVISNEQVGLSEDSIGIYINGSPINLLELDIFELNNKVREELKTIKRLVKLGFDTVQSKILISKFALLSAVKQNQFRNGNTIMGNNDNRFKVYAEEFKKNSFHKGGVLFANDIELNENYQTYSTDRQNLYLGADSHKLKSNQIPPLRENVHDLIFAINLGDKQQLKAFFTFSKLILDTGIPQQVGILPLIGDDPLDFEIANRLYNVAALSDTKEALALIYKYMETKTPDETEELLNKIDASTKIEASRLKEVADKFSIDRPSVIVNGVIHDLSSSNWQLSMSNQIAQDISLIKTYLRLGPVEGKLKDTILYKNAKSERNLQVVPLDPADIIYKSVNQNLMNMTIAFKKIDKSLESSAQFWLVSNFSDENNFEQLINLLEFIKKHPASIRVLNTGNTHHFEKLERLFKLNTLTNTDIDKIISSLKEPTLSISKKDSVVQILEKNQLPAHHSFLLVNSRYVRLEPSILNLKEIDQLFNYEINERLTLIKNIVDTYPDEFDKNLAEYYSIRSGLDILDWFDLLTSVITKSFYTDEKLYLADVNRYDFESLDFSNSIDIKKHNSSNPIDVLLIIDPLLERSQKLINIVNSIKDYSFINIRILLQPKTEYNQEEIPKRFYRGQYPDSTPIFDTNGKWNQTYKIKFDHLPTSRYSLKVNEPNNWVVSEKYSTKQLDLSDFYWKGGETLISYELSDLIVEGYARDIKSGKTPSNLQLKLSNDNYSGDTRVMSALNYFQLRAKPGIYSLRTVSDHALLSASTNRFESNTAKLEDATIPIFSLNRLTLNARVTSEEPSHAANQKAKYADINIFTIAGGQQYEKLASIMIASVRKHNPKNSIKFWILDNFISSQFRSLIPFLSDFYNVEIELIKYKWPNFLRKQTTRQREIWGYKILFLDVLFPQDLDRIIFIDADQICRTELTPLVDMDLERAPYAFTPMCETNEDTKNFRFWKEGYWSEVLKEDLKYHISALFVVDLQKFKSMNAGDRLRSHYQRLSSDANSLSNLDQDLPNNLQRSIKIKSLDQDWLWCETWCSHDTLKDAKMIDLCNNPLTFENKIDTAKRLIPEWVDYEAEVNQLLDRIDDNPKEVVLEEDTLDELNFQADDTDEDAFDYHDEL
ncbi:KRE5 [Candida pseudojiufengensis]|uniref:KRE5 n=1 Tax=Candida pseudojiufengensis TaxID=497109 RepID=UPI0022244B30|nr:KRE5 [Candida pseudojiufengensis]KAI5966456.1 KRE5 [Candida pseudojiufengensis]